ncbi:hypothetical protein ACN27F_27050 [Solwaraspora sp. WMMB335]|uniref:hypothetical protein n=1 Tax=Solwaraspora sp. WMMB335 TaxID=3404118 RepID=UPI003B95B2AE
MGTTRVWQIGVDPYPAIKFCDPTSELTGQMDTFIADVAAGEIDTAAEVDRLGS